MRHRLDEELREREKLEEEIRHLKEQVAVLTEEHDKHSRRIMTNGGSGRSSLGSESPLISISKPNHMRDTINGQRATIAKLFEQVGLHKILSLLESEDVDVRVYGVKVVANLVAEGLEQFLLPYRDILVRKIEEGKCGRETTPEVIVEEVKERNVGGPQLLNLAAHSFLCSGKAMA